MKQTSKFITVTLFYIIPVLIILVTLYTRIRLLEVPLERDEGEYAYMGQLMLKGIPPFVAAYSMKLPGIYGAYALIMALFGQTVRGIHIGLLLVNVTCIGFMFLLGRKFADEKTGSIAAAVFALLSVSSSVYGIFTHATHFVVLFALAGFLLLFMTIDRRKLPLALLSGVMFGFAFLMKQHAAPIIAFAFAWLLFQLIRLKAGRRHTIISSLLFCIGVVIPYALCCFYLYEKGAFAKFWFWTVSYAAEYVTGVSLREGIIQFKNMAQSIVHISWPLWLLAGAGLAVLLRKEEGWDKRLFLGGLLASSFAAVSPGFYFRHHYFVLMLPVVALLAATAATYPFRLQKPVNTQLQMFFAALITLMFTITVYNERAYYFTLTPRQVSRGIYGPNPFIESVEIAQHLKANTTPSDRIAVLGSEPQICFYADRVSATGHIYMYGLMEKHPLARSMQVEAIREIEKSKPKYVVLVNVNFSWLVSPVSDRTLFKWADSYLKDQYEIDGAIDIVRSDYTVVRWGAEARNYSVKAENNLMIYRRKDI